MKKIKLGLIVAAAIGAMLAFTGCGAQKVDLNDYVTVEVTGYDGFGTASAKVDTEKMKEVVDDENAVAAIEAAAIVAFKENNNYSNGDTVEYRYNIPDNIVNNIKDKYGIMLKFKESSATVEGLKDPSEFDPADILEFEFGGTSPSGYVHIKSTISDFDVEVDKENGLANGDTIGITFELKDNSKSFESACASNNLPVFDPEYQYTITELPEYVTSIDEISDGVRTTLNKHMKELIDNTAEYYKVADKTVGAGNGGKQADSVKYVGATFINKNGGSNVLILIYETHYVLPAEATTYRCAIQSGINTSEEIEDDDVYFDTSYISKLSGINGYFFEGFESVDALLADVQSHYDLSEIPTLQEYDYE